MPQPIKLSALLYVGSLAAGQVYNAFILHWEKLADPKTLAFLLLGFFLFFGPLVWLFYEVYRGYNWARIAYAIVTCLSLLPYIKKLLATLETPSVGYFYFVQAAVSLVIVILLYLPSSNRWFRLCKLHRRSLKS
jgi:hypothetical protein